MVYDRPAPLVDAAMSEVPARIGAGGAVIEPLDEDAVRAAVAELVAAGVEALTVCLLNSYANPPTSRPSPRSPRRSRPALPVSASSDVLPSSASTSGR